MFHQICLPLVPKRVLRDITAFYSSMQLKNEFMKKLKDVRSINNTIRFCGLTLEAKKILMPLLNTVNSTPEYCQSSDITAHGFIHQMKNIIAEDKPGCIIVEKILAVLNYDLHSNSANELLQLLFEIYYPKSISPENKYSDGYLKKLIWAVYRLTNSYHKNSLYSKFLVKYPNPIERIDALQSALVDYSVTRARSLLTIIFDIGHSRIDFTSEENRQLGMLMIGVIERIVSAIESFRNNPEWGVENILIKRSALEFLFEYCASFSAPDGTPLKYLYEGKLNKCKGHLDNEITGYYYYVEEFGEYNSDKVIYCENHYKRLAFYKKLESELPESHSWWAERSKHPNIDKYLYY